MEKMVSENREDDAMEKMIIQKIYKPVLPSHSHQARKYLPCFVLGFVLMSILIIIGSTMFWNHKTECKSVGGMCLVNGTRCEGAERMIMSFSCDSKEPNAICCVHAKEMAKIDISKERWQNNCTCDPDEKTEDSVCIDEVPPETKKLEEGLHKEFPHMILTLSKFDDCRPEMPQSLKTNRTIIIRSDYLPRDMDVEKRRAAVKFIYSYLFYVVTKTTRCKTGIEKVIFSNYNDTTSTSYSSLVHPYTIYDNKFDAHITIVLNSCGSKKWVLARNTIRVVLFFWAPVMAFTDWIAIWLWIVIYRAYQHMKDVEEYDRGQAYQDKLNDV